MNIGLQRLLEEFGSGITKSKLGSYMPVLKNSFIPYLDKKYSNDIEKSIDRFFSIMISSRDIIDGGVNYIDNTKKVVGEAAIDKYLTTINAFFKTVIYPKWPNCQLSTVENFKIFYDDIKYSCKKDLKQYSPRVHLNDSDYKNLLEYLDELNNTSARSAMAKAVIPLILLYGFKVGTLADIRTDCFSPEMRKLKLNDQDIWLELPYKVFVNVNNIYIKNINAPYLFDIGENQRLISDYLDDIINAYNSRISNNAKITLDGLSKYAVINMFLAGMNPIAIENISGMREQNLRYCQKIAWEMTEKRLNSYVNSILRSIKNYDDFNL